MAVITVVTGLSVGTALGALSVTVRSAQISPLGRILVSEAGRTLYHDASETKNVVKCVGSCAKEWPPLLIAAGAKAVAEPGATASLLGTVKRPDGMFQVTYRGMPLYLFSGDRSAGDVNGQGAAGIWHAIAPSGSVVTKAVRASANPAGNGSGSGAGSSSTSGGGTVTGSGGGYGAPTDPCVLHPDGPGCGM